MFNIISWGSFLTIIALIVGGYYTITLLALYRNELVQWVRSLSHPSTPESDTSPIVNKRPLENMMGIAQPASESPAVRSSEIAVEDIITASNEDEPELVQKRSNSDDLLIGTVADLLQEIKTLIQLIAEYKTGKSESEALFNALFIRYPHLQDTSYPQAISFYLAEAAKETFSFDLTPDEVMSWWNEPAPSAKH